MTVFPSLTDDQLVSELWARNVRFIRGKKPNHPPLLGPIELIVGLAESHDARVGISLIPLFLQYPEFAAHVRKAANAVSKPAQILLQCYYTAAVWLEQKLFSRMSSLPDLFSKELDLTLAQNPDENLRALGKRQQELSGEKLNWQGSYEHAAEVWLKEMELQKA